MCARECACVRTLTCTAKRSKSAEPKPTTPTGLVRVTAQAQVSCRILKAYLSVHFEHYADLMVRYGIFIDIHFRTRILSISSATHLHHPQEVVLNVLCFVFEHMYPLCSLIIRVHIMKWICKRCKCSTSIATIFHI